MSKLVLSVEDEDEVDDLLLTYSLEPDQTFICDTTGQQMPFWTPPTPPQDDSDLYMDSTQTFIYEPTVMFESQLPPVYVRKGHKRHRLDPLGRKPKLHARDDLPPIPRSLFDCPQTMAQRMERNAHLLKQGMMKPAKAQMQAAVAAAVGAVGIRPVMEPVHDHPEWLVHEDWALLQALQTLQELPLNLVTASPGHIPNWDLVADIVNGCSRVYRSPKQCKNRYENFIVAREEGRPVYDPSPRKLKKASKGIYKTKSNRAMRTNQLYLQDNCKASTTLYTLRFDAIKAMAAKRTPPVRPQLSATVGAGQKNTKHLAVLAENGINYDRPLSPVQVATMRAERIAKEKKVAVPQAVPGADSQQPAQQPMGQPRLAVPASAPQQLVLQPQQAVAAAAAAAAGHVILQPGQQLISTATGQQVLASIDGRAQQMAIVQGPTTGPVAASLLQPAAIVRASAAAVAAAGNAAVMTTMPLARGINMTGIIVSQTLPGQTFATAINRGQTVVAPLQVPNTQLRGMVRGPFVTKDMTGVTVVSQAAASALTDGNVTKVMATTSLAQTQLVFTQQKHGFVALPSVASGAVPQQLLSLSMAPGVTATPVVATAKGPTGIQQVQLMRPKQQVIQQLRPTQQQVLQQTSTVGGSVVTGGAQKTVTVTTPLITNISQAQMPAIQLRHAPQIHALIRRPQQQPKGMPGTIGPNTVVQQIQFSRGQIPDGVQIQQVPSSLTPQTVATLMKTASSAAAAGITNVTIAGSNTINVSIAQQKLLTAGKTTIQAQQIRQLQMQKRPGAVQIQGPQKVTALQHMGKLPAGTPPVIFRPPQVVVQQMAAQQQLMKQQQTAVAAAGSAQQPAMQHIISSVPISASSAAGMTAVLTTQILGQATAGATPPPATKTLAMTLSTQALQGAGIATIALSSTAQISAIATSALSAGTSVKLISSPSGTAFIKPVKDNVTAGSLSVLPPQRAPIQPVLVRPSQAISVVSSPAHITLATVSCARSSSSIGAAGVNNGSVVVGSSALQPVASQQPVLPAVQQAVQDIVQQAQAQARQPIQPTIGFVTMTTVGDGGNSSQATTTNLSSPLPAGTSLIATAQSPVDGSMAQNKSSPYVMRLRNQKS
jgi:E1A-binding protein p400